jgi:ribonuclease T1
MTRAIYLVILVLAVLVGACGGDETGVLEPTVGPTLAVRVETPSSETPRAVEPQRPAEINGFETVALEELPPEAIETLRLVERDGPFPYRQDGQVFQNRERLLPRKHSEYYHEYTVETPGSDDRGARRIVTGEDGEVYYTDDHYESFRIIYIYE